MEEKNNNNNSNNSTENQNKETNKPKNNNFKNKKNKRNINKKNNKKEENVSLSEKQKIKITLLELEIAKLKMEIEKNNEELRTKALELQNKAKEEIQKHKDETSSKFELELTNIKKYGIQKFFESFLIPLKNLELAIQAGEKQDNSAVQNYVKGFSMLLKQMELIFSDFGIQKIEPFVGENYNPELHEVFETEENSQLKDKIVSIKSNGYKLYDRVVKPASVIVGK
ncbi:nucleotide exchange factor GrpE [Mesomycoplasma molare]|uniref:Protein GrpE n=1 Tax=Mesomycoplasma molare TaxID=171288 RepID=A0ABY5TUA5_9BACT|nr:nucleotide exchange factor GrpE [Mesomycoplasma molare]UWD34249.1 nucleotide exchange factor GrpE [Mesomycoplasma molare]